MRGSRLFKGAIVALGLLAMSGPAKAQSSAAAAVALFDEGRAALQRGELDLACAKFKESNRLGPAIGTAFNLANCEEQRGRLATAWVLFRQVVGQMKPDDPRLQVANERIASLEKRVPRVIFAADQGTPKGTRVRVNELELESASFGSAIPLDPGEHQAVIRSPGMAPRTVTFTLNPGETTTLTLNPPAPARQSSHEAASSTPPDASADNRILGVKRSDALLITGGVGAAGLAIGIITGLVGLSAESKGNLQCSEATKTCSQEGYDANQRAKSMAVVSTVGFVVGVLGGGAATYLYFTTPTGGSAEDAAIVGVGGRW